MIELETDPPGPLRVKIRDDLKRTWAKETRLQRQEKRLQGQTPAALRRVRQAVGGDGPEECLESKD